MSNQENEPSKLPAPSIVKLDITEGHTPLPATSLLSEAERKRLDELARTRQAIDPTDKEETITTFEDGATFKYIPRPLPPGSIQAATEQCVIIEATGKQIAIVKDANLAEFLCNAANMFVLAQLKHQADGTQMQTFSKPIIFPGK